MTSGIILAGGFSSRMGQNKAEMDFHGQSLLECQIDKLRRIGLEDIVVAGILSSKANVRSVPDLYPRRGPLAGLHAGLLAVRGTEALVLAVDTPLVPEALLSMLLSRHRGGITVVSCNGEIEPLIGVYDKTLAADCESLLQGENRSLRQLFRQTAVTTLDYNGDPDLLMNCNTEAEYRKALSCCRHVSGRDFPG